MIGGVNTTRMRIAFFVFLALWSLLLWRLAGQCLWPPHDLRTRVLELSVSRQELAAPRGELLDRHGHPLATNVTHWSLWGNPAAVGNLKKVAALIAQATGESEGATFARLKSLPQHYQCLAPELRYPENLRAGLAARHGMDLRETHKRLYPEGALGAHVLGMLGKDGNGLEGIELSYDDVLAGEPGWIACLRDGAGGYYPAAGMPQQDPVPGKTLVLTLDREIQEVSEMVLGEAVLRWHAKGGSIVVIEPATGDVLAIANSPSYDPRDPAAASMDARRNRAITDTYEPGSTMKVVLASLVLDRGLMDSEDSMFAEEGSYSLGRGTLRDSHPHGWLTFREAFAQSSNIFFYKLAGLVSGEDFYRTMRDFGFGAPTGIALPGEATGVLRKPSSWSSRSQGTMAIGQEVSVTPLQLAMGYAAIANHGVLMRPRLVSAIRDPLNGVETPIPPGERRRVVSGATAEVVASFCEGVVSDGTGSNAQLAGIRVGGKTGTAQIAAPNGGGYIAGAFCASFVGFAPVESPRFVSLVVLREPRGGHYGGSVAAPAFGELAERLLALPAGPDDRGADLQLASAAPALPGDRHAAGASATRGGRSRGGVSPAIAAVVPSADLTGAIDGAARGIRHFRQGDRARTASAPVSASASGPAVLAALDAVQRPAGEAAPPSMLVREIEIPDLTGLTLREARRALTGLGLLGECDGSGVVREMVPAPGSMVPVGSRVALKAAPGEAG